MKAPKLSAAAVLAIAALSSMTAQGRAPGGDLDRATRARDATLELDVTAAKQILDGADPTDPALALERGRLAIYAQDCDAAAQILSRSDLAATNAGAELAEIAKGCARATAATIVEKDEAKGVEVRLQDDDDRPLVPILVEVASRARDMLAKELGVTLPRPLHIVVVRDQFTLAAMTGLPEQAARTTGTVAVAKWGRVTMISPRAADGGYAWLDTLVHEMTHLALTAGSRDKAPLWLQEGVAKREEVRWREAEPLDDVPSADAIAAIGLEKGLGRPIDQLGPSIAMLPSPEQAQVAFAEVTSFLRFWLKESGDEALPQLVLRLKASNGTNDDVAKAIAETSGSDFAAWDKRWRAYLSSAPRELPADLAPGGSIAHAREVTQRLRLGELLAARDHHGAAAIELARAQQLAPFEPSLRCSLAASLLAEDRRGDAKLLVEKPEEVHGRNGRFFSLHGLLAPAAPDPETSFQMALALDPLDPAVACEEKQPPERPSDPTRAAICDMARKAPRWSP